jgi:uncharacterized protein (DUF111 family)
MLILATLDDISGVVVPHAIDRLMECGAKNVHVSQTITKKGRVGLLFIVDVADEDVDSVGDAMMSELGTLGYNILETRHVHSLNKTIQHRLVVKSGETEKEYYLSVKKSSMQSGLQIKSEPETRDLTAVIENVKKDFNTVLPMKMLINEIKADLDGDRKKTSINIS